MLHHNQFNSFYLPKTTREQVVQHTATIERLKKTRAEDWDKRKSATDTSQTIYTQQH